GVKPVHAVVSELLAELERGKCVEVVALGQEQRGVYLLELGLPALDVDSERRLARLESRLARRDLLVRPAGPQAHPEAGRPESLGDGPGPPVPADDQDHRRTGSRDPEKP